MARTTSSDRMRFTRREALRLWGIAAGGLALGACGPAAPPASTAPTPGASTPTSTPAAFIPGTVDVLKPTTPKVATLEMELALPDSVVEAARREGKLRFVSSIDKEPAAKIVEAFKKRYAGIDVDYQEASEEARSVRTLTEFKAGRNRNDAVMGVGGFLAEFKSAGALTSLDGLPAYANYDVPFRDTGSEWAGVRIQFWGIGYNTERVPDAQLPKSWDDLTDPKWKGRIGMGDRPQLWAQQLWKVWGAERTTAFLTKLFANSPQRRKEGLDASANLLGAGEFDLYIPSAPYRIQELKGRGAPVGWFSPDPLTVAVSELVIVTKSPSPNAARVFVNWFISREGQDVYSRADSVVPTHPALRSQRDYLGIFADRFVGRPASVRQPEDELKVLPEVRKVWSELWTK